MFLNKEFEVVKRGCHSDEMYMEHSGVDILMQLYTIYVCPFIDLWY